MTTRNDCECPDQDIIDEDPSLCCDACNPDHDERWWKKKDKCEEYPKKEYDDEGIAVWQCKVCDGWVEWDISCDCEEEQKCSGCERVVEDKDLCDTCNECADPSQPHRCCECEE
jgi:hypothetical protein